MKTTLIDRHRRLFVILFAIAVIVPLRLAAQPPRVFEHPLYVQPDTVSICFLPLKATGQKGAMLDVGSPISKLLSEKDDFNYEFLFPTPSEAPNIYDEGFLKEAGKTYPGRPLFDYWRDRGVRYLMSGRYSADDDNLVIELFFYDLQSAKPFHYSRGVSFLEGKRYSLPREKLPIFYGQAADLITEALEKEGRHPRDPE